jgi:ATP-dependent Zn protease
MRESNHSFVLALLTLALALWLVALGASEPKWPFVLFLAGAALLGWALVRYYGVHAPTSGIAPKSAAPAQEGAAPIKPVHSMVNFKDVAGLGGALEELEEIVEFFRDPKKYRRFGVQLPKGVLLSGPPGTGKTLMAKAIAGEAGVPFFYAGGSSFVHMYVGVGPKKVHELFLAARKRAPAIIFIDEIDAVGKARGGLRGDERESTLNQLLTEMDGFESREPVIVIAATNRYEMLDSALLRPGRFDRKIEVGLPNLADRKRILEIHLEKKPHELDLDDLAAKAVGFSGAALAALANEAAIYAAKHDLKVIDSAAIEAVRQKVISLKKTGDLLGGDLRHKLAFYQAAKAVAAKNLDLAMDPLTLRGGFIKLPTGAVASDVLIDLIAAHLAGLRAAHLAGEASASFSTEDVAIARRLARSWREAFDPARSHTIRDLIARAESVADGALADQIPRISQLADRLYREESTDGPF